MANTNFDELPVAISLTGNEVVPIVQGGVDKQTTTGAIGGTSDANFTLDQIGSTQGNVLYRGAAAWQVLAPGTAGYVLTTHGGGADPTWATNDGSVTVGATIIGGGTTTRVLYDNAGTLGEYAVSGSGSVAMTTSPTFVTPTLGAALATSINGLAITTVVGGTLTLAAGKALNVSNTLTLAGDNGVTVNFGGGITIASGKNLTVSNTLTFTGSDSASVNFGAGGTVLYTTAAATIVVGSSVITSGTATRILYDNAGVLGEYTIAGSGTIVAMATAPTFVTSITTPSVLATSNGSGSIGASGTAFSSLFLASGGVINWAAGNVTLTHSSGNLTLAGGNLIFSADNTLDIGASGATRPRAIYVATNVTAGGSWVGSGDVRVGAASQLYWNGKSLVGSSADGLIELYNNAGTSFGRLNFGGTTSSFPSLKRSSADLQARLADDSAYANIAGANIIVGGTTTLNAPSDGVLRLTNAAATDFTRLQFGGTTASFPSLKRASAALTCRLADDSADAAFNFAGGTVTGHVLFGTDNTYDIGASGATRPRNIYVAGQVIIGNTPSTGILQFPSDGVLEITNAAGTDFSYMQLGGATSSFPAIKRSSTTIQARLADDSAYTAFEALRYGAGGANSTSTFINIAACTTASSSLRFIQGAAPTSPVDGDMWREDNTNTGLKVRINGVTKTVTVS